MKYFFQGGSNSSNDVKLSILDEDEEGGDGAKKNP